MSDDDRSPDLAPARQPSPPRPSRPGLIRSIAHRLAGEPIPLPVEGAAASFDGATGGSTRSH